MKSQINLKLIAVLAISLALSLVASAATDTWNGGSATTGNWSDAGNWGGTAPNAMGDNLVFSGNARPISTNNLVTSVGWIQLNPTAAFSIYGSSLTNNFAFTNSAQNNNWYAPLILGGNVNFDVASGTTLTIPGVVSGGNGVGITQTSAGTLYLTNYNNTFTGAVSVVTGTLQLGYLPNTATYTFPGTALSLSNATLYFNGTSASTYVHTYNFPNLTGPIGFTNSTLKFQSAAATTKALNAAINFSGTNTISYTSSSYTHNENFNRALTGSGTLVFNWSGTTSGRSININDTLNGNTFTGTIILNTTPAAGNFNLNKPLGPVAYVISNSWTLVNAPSNNLDNATAVSLFSSGSGLNLSAYGWSNSAAPLTINAGTVILGNATTGTVVSIGNLSGTGGVITNIGTFASSLTVNQTSDATYAGSINDNGVAPLSFTKNGPALLTLTKTNSYLGATTINGGSLIINGQLASTNVMVNTNAVLGGAGTLLGSTTVNAGGTISAVNNAALTLNTLALGTSSSDNLTLNCQGNGTTVVGYVAVTGSGGLTNNGTVTVNVVGSLPPTVGTYTLLTYSGAMTGTGTFVVGSLTSGAIGYVTNNVSASAIQLVVTGTDYLRWVGSPTKNWDLLGSNVWVFGSSGLPASYQDTKRVAFDGTAANFVVNVAAAVAPGGIEVTNNTGNYAFGGSGKITGGTTLTKDGSGTLTITTTNDYSGLTFVNSGTIQLGDGTAKNGSVTSSISNNAALVFANPSSQTYAGVISGPGTLSKQSAGVLTVSGNNTFDGLTTISGGTLAAGSATALGSTNAGTTVASGGTLDVNGQNLGAEAVGISGQGVGNNGAVVNNGAAQTQALQLLTLNANSTIGGLSRWDVRGVGSTLNLNGLTLTKTGSNQVTLVESAVSDGNIVINQGELGFQVGVSFPAGLGQITVNSGGTLGVSDWGTPNQISQPVTLNGGTLLADAGGTTATLNSPVTLTTNSTILVSCPLLLTNIVGGTGLLTVSGTSTLVLDTSNTWSGGLVISSNATVQIGNNDNNGALPASVLVVTNNGLLAYSLVTDMIFTQPMVGTGGLEQAGPNTITITNHQSYTGGTVLQAGTLLLAGGNNTLSNATRLSFTGNSTLNMGTNSQDVSSLTINNTVTGTVLGSGALNVIGTTDLRLGSTGNTSAALSMAGLNNFSYINPTNVFSVGGQNLTGTSAGSAILALTNTITAKWFGIADNGGYPGYTSTGTVSLGETNAINANTVVVGYGQGTTGGWAATGTLNFQSGLTDPSLIIRDASGTGRVNMIVGYAANSDYSAGNGTVDLISGVTGTSTLDALVGNLIIGQHNYNNVNFSRSATGTFTMGNGTLDATNIVIGQKTSSAGKTTSSAIGTFSLSGGTVKVNTMLIGDQVGNNGPSVSGTFNLNSGTLLAQTIQAGAGTASRTLNWNDGIIQNYNSGSDLTITGIALSLTGAGTPTFNLTTGRTGTIASSLSGSGPLVNAGSGTLILGGDNSGFSGTLTNQIGTVYLNGPTPFGTIEVYNNAVLAGTNSAGTILIDAGGIVQPGASTGAGVLGGTTLNLGAVGSTTDLTHSHFKFAAGMISATTVNANGTNIVDIAGPILTTGTNNLILYTGAIGGNGINGFKLGSLPAGVVASLQDNPGVAVQLVVTSSPGAMPTNIITAVSGNTLTLAWPADHTGWRLLVQTNNLAAGISSNTNDWGAVSGSATTNQISILMDATKLTEFYRLVYP
jgi:autotransporter-associated beta strand protein